MNAVFLTMAQLGACKLQLLEDLTYKCSKNPGPHYTVRSRSTVNACIFFHPSFTNLSLFSSKWRWRKI